MSWVFPPSALCVLVRTMAQATATKENLEKHKPLHGLAAMGCPAPSPSARLWQCHDPAP